MRAVLHRWWVIFNVAVVMALAVVRAFRKGRHRRRALAEWKQAW